MTRAKLTNAKCASYLAGLLVVTLSGVACSSTSDSPTSEVVTATASTEFGTTPTSHSTTEQESTEQEPAETERHIFEVPGDLLTNLSDLSTPLGTLCWAMWEYGRIHILQFIADMTEVSGLEVIYPDVSNGESAGEPDDYTFLDALEEIQKPEIMMIANDPELSEELQIYARAFFELVAATERQARAVGFDSIDDTQLPYQDLGDLPHSDTFNEAAMNHPEECVLPPDEEIEEPDIIQEPSSFLPANDQESTEHLAESERHVFEVPKSMVINPSDLSTPLGTLCWALWEYGRMTNLQLVELLVGNTSNVEVVYPDVSNEESARRTDDYTFIDALEEIQKPEIVAIVNDPEMSEELRIYARAFFELVAATEKQTRTVGFENIDYTQLPYQDLDDLPHAEDFDEAARGHPEECIVPTD